MTRTSTGRTSPRRSRPWVALNAGHWDCVATIEHLLKLQASPAREPRAGWRATVRRCRLRVEDLLKDNPSLRPLTDKVVADEMETGRRSAEVAFEEHGEIPVIDAQSVLYSKDEVLGEWFPEEPR